MAKCKHERLMVCKVDFEIPDGEVKRVFCYHCAKTKTEIDLEDKLQQSEAQCKKLQQVADAAAEMVKCQNGGYVEFHTYYGKALRACEKALRELEQG